MRQPITPKRTQFACTENLLSADGNTSIFDAMQMRVRRYTARGSHRENPHFLVYFYPVLSTKVNKEQSSHLVYLLIDNESATRICLPPLSP